MPTAFIFINTEPTSMPEVLEKVGSVEGVEEAKMVIGVYDIIAKVKASTMDRLKQIVSLEIRRLDKVLETQSLLVVQQE